MFNDEVAERGIESQGVIPDKRKTGGLEKRGPRPTYFS